MNSKITLTFSAPILDGDALTIQRGASLPDIVIPYALNGVNGINPTGSVLTDLSATKTYINNVYNATGSLSVNINTIINTVTIEDNINQMVFVESSNNTAGRVTSVAENFAVIGFVQISSVDISENAANPCGLVDLTIHTTEQVTEITSPVIQSVTTNPFIITGVSRDSVNDIVITVNNGIYTDTNSVFIPVNNSSAFDLSVITTPTQSTATIRPLQNRYSVLEFQYSLDNITFIDSSSFNDLPNGSYVFYVRDNIGCTSSIPFEIVAFEANVIDREAYFKVSEQNSLIAVNREEIDDSNIFKNETNTLSFEEETAINNRSFKQLFTNKDGVCTQQFRSNYDNVEVKLFDCDGNESSLIPDQKTQNFNITDVRDVTLIDVQYQGNTFVGVQYKTGNTYDPDTLSQNGSYNLATSVPEFMNENDYMQIEGAGWFKVINVSYFDGVQTIVLESLVSSFILPMNQTVKGTAIYDILPYEVYEVSIDLNTLLGDYYITYEATHTEYATKDMRTEWFNVAESQRDTYVLSYVNTVNNETNYSTGIVNKIRLPFEKRITLIPSDEQDVYFTDTNAVSVDSEYREFYSLELRSVPTNMARKIGVILTNDRLLLNGLSVLKNGELEQERIGVTNMYKITVQFVRSDYVIQSNASDGSIVLPISNAIKLTGSELGILLTK